MSLCKRLGCSSSALGCTSASSPTSHTWLSCHGTFQTCRVRSAEAALAATLLIDDCCHLKMGMTYMLLRVRILYTLSIDALATLNKLKGLGIADLITACSSVNSLVTVCGYILYFTVPGALGYRQVYRIFPSLPPTQTHFPAPLQLGQTPTDVHPPSQHLPPSTRSSV